VEVLRTAETQFSGDAAGVDAEGLDQALVFSVGVFYHTVYSSFGDAVRRIALFTYRSTPLESERIDNEA